MGTATITRRMFLNAGLVTGAAAAVGAGWFPSLTTLDVEHAKETVRFAWISDTHLYAKAIDTRYVDNTIRAVKDVARQAGGFDFLIFGGDLAQLGRREELDLGSQILSELEIRKLFIPGEHDWYLDMGEHWQRLFGRSPWSMDLKGVHFVGLNTIGQALDFWTAKRMTAEERMAAMAVIDNAVNGPWAAVGPEQLRWLADDLAGQSADEPIVIFSHNPLYEYYPRWNFWVRDWREVQEVLRPFRNVTNVHGHVHQVSYSEVGTMRSIGMLATSWPWPYPAEGVPRLTRPLRFDPSDPFDGVGWVRLAATAAGVEHDYMMWNVHVYRPAAESPEEPGPTSARTASGGPATTEPGR